MKFAFKSATFFLIASLIFTSFVDAQSDKPKLILDADTANEIDDMYAIVRILKQDKFDVLALTSTQWIHYLAEEDSVGASQRENEALVKLLGRHDLPTPIGSKEPMGKPWGGFEPKKSPAADFIIKAAKQASPENKLTVVCLGATTNLASAIATAPEIAPNINAYALGFRYDLEKSVWNKSSFNVRRDLNAADFVLNQKDLQLSIMPANVARPLTFPRDETFKKHEKLGELGEHLTSKWKARFAEFENWVMWDLALVEAILDPSMATTREVMTPPENTQRKIRLYDSIDVEAMRRDYWSVVMPKPTKSETSFKPYPDKFDMMVVVAHPDDEGYFSGMLSHYAMTQEKKVIVVSLTSGEWGNGLPHHKSADEKPVYSFDGSEHPRFAEVPEDATYPCYFRETEMARALHAYGIKYRPIMPRFRDMSGIEPWGKPDGCLAYWGGTSKVVGYVASQIRRFRPDVVVTLPVDGNNGNPQHCAASRATFLSFDVAGKSDADPDRLGKLSTWRPKKLYLQVSEEEQKQSRYSQLHSHHWDTPCPNADGKTAREIAATANAKHKSQDMREEADASTKFVLAITNVGKDKVSKDNLFENVN